MLSAFRPSPSSSHPERRGLRALPSDQSLPSGQNLPSGQDPQRCQLDPDHVGSSPKDSQAPSDPEFHRVGRACATVSALSLGAVLLLSASSAHAQAIDGEFSVQRFTAAPGPRNLFTTRRLRMDGNLSWSAGFMANYAYKPLTLRECDSPACENPGDEFPIVENMVTADVMGSLTIIPRLQIGLRIPVTWVKGQGVTEAGTPDLAGDGVNAVGLGDAELEGKFRFYGEANSPLALGAALFVTGPLGQATTEDGSYIGDSSPSVGLRGIVDGQHGPVFYAVNLSGVFRESGRIGNSKAGSEFRYGVGGGYQISPLLAVLIEGFGSTRFTTERGENALEALLGAQITPLSSGITVSAGAGTGLVEGIGVPNVRAFLGLTFATSGGDRDKDGIGDGDDLCPAAAEDIDGFEDEDGCPEADNDGDTIADAADKCANEAEDPDAFEDTDGCPEADNDGDTIPDNNDACPLEPETKNGFQDTDGCPDEPDTDADGVVDSKDKCINEKEDTDGFQDTDGCPDPDNDGDGVPDIQDECIDQQETKNGFQDEDGCPDEAPAEPEP